VSVPRTQSLCLALGLCATGTAYAQSETCNTATVEAQITMATDLRRRSMEQGAFEILRDLWQRCPSPRIECQMALAEQGLHRWRDAFAHLTEALSTDTDPWIVSRRTALLGALGEVRSHLPRIDLRVNVAHAVLTVNGSRVGELPLREPYVVPDGHAEVLVEAQGYVAWRRTVSLADDEALQERVVLEAVATPISTPTPTPARPPPPPAHSRTREVIGWSLTGTGVALLGIGIWQALVWNASSTETTTATIETAGAPGAWARLARDTAPVSASDLCDRAESNNSADGIAVRDLCQTNRTNSTVALLSGLGGVALVTTGVLLLVTAPARHNASTAWVLSPWLTPHTQGLSLGASF
jgi:hypothetical protein